MTCSCPLCGGSIVDDGRVRLDPGSGLVVAADRFVRLPALEFSMFEALWTSRPRTLAKEKLLAASAGYTDDEREVKMVDVVICKLRKKLAPLGVGIGTTWGHGYHITMERTLKNELDQPGHRSAAGP